jgi:hypothetical protein
MNESQPVQAVTRHTGLGHADTRKAVDSVIATVGKTPQSGGDPADPQQPSVTDMTAAFPSNSDSPDGAVAHDRASSRARASNARPRCLLSARKQARRPRRLCVCGPFGLRSTMVVVTETGSARVSASIIGIVQTESPRWRALCMRSRGRARPCYPLSGCVPQSGAESAPPCVTCVRPLPSALIV